MKKIKVGDKVIVIAGSDKGKIGKVLELSKDSKVVVEGVNEVTKHQKPNPRMQVPGGKIKINLPIHISNIAICNEEGKKDKVVFQTNENGKRVRVYRSNKELVPTVQYERKIRASAKAGSNEAQASV